MSRRPGFRFNRGRVSQPTGSPPVYSTLAAALSDLGAVLQIDFYDSDNYTLSGADITGVDNVITSTALTVNGTPQYTATGFNSGPCMVLDGLDDYLQGTESAVYNLMQDNNAFTLIFAIQWAGGDATGDIFSCADSTQNGQSYRNLGQWNNADGKYRELSADDAAAGASLVSDSGTVSTAPILLELRNDGSASSLKQNRVAVPGFGGALAPGNLTPNNWGLGAWVRLSTTNFAAANISLALGFPAALSATQLNALYDSITNHDSALALL